MSRDVNTVTLTGNLTGDAEYRVTPSGTGLVTFGLAVNDSVKNQQTGEWEDKPSFFDCVKYGNVEHLSEFLTKGRFTVVTGKLRQDRWEKDGQRHERVVVVVREVKLPPTSQGGGRQVQASESPMADAYSDNDIPF